MAPVLRFATITLLVVLPALSQQKYIGKYDVFGGYGYLNSAKIALSENGFHTQVGMRTRTWLSLGFDYSRFTGDTALSADMLLPELQASLAATMQKLAQAGMIPPGYHLSVPVSSTTQTFAAGPQVSYHKFKGFTPFLRPSLGAMREVVYTHPADPIATAITKQLAPTGKAEDWQGFYGVGGGFDVNVHKHAAIRFQADFVWDHLFNDMLPWRSTVRFSVGPAFQFGKNMVE